MKRLLLGALLLGLLSACSTTKITYVYKAGDYDPVRYKKVAVIAIAPKNTGRMAIEDAVVAELRAKGVRAMHTWSIFMFANDPEMLKKAGFEGEKKMEVIRQKVEENNIDALLIITLFNAKREQRYVAGSSVSVGVGVAGPVYGYPYAAYFGYAWEVASTPGYYEDVSTYFLESNLYDIASEKLLWSGQSKTEMSKPLEAEAEGFGRIMVARLMDDSRKPAK